MSPRRWRRASLHAIRWFPSTTIGPCYRGGLVIQERQWWGIQRREYVVHALPTGRFGIEHEWSMK